MKRPFVPAAWFGIVLGLVGMGQAWRVAARVWGMPALVGEGVLVLAATVWACLLVAYLRQALERPAEVRDEFLHPVRGCTPALLAVSTLLVALAAVPVSRPLAWLLAAAGIGGHLSFCLWHTGRLWQGGRNAADAVPTLYLPTVAGNFTSAAVLGALGHTDWGWLFLGAGVFSWIALESLIVQRLWQPDCVPPVQRPLLGIHFAPPAVCAMAWLNLAPGNLDQWLLMLWGYGLFQLLVGLRLWRWLGEQPFAPSYWAYTFGIAATTVAALKLAEMGLPAAQWLAPPIFVAANLFIGYLALRTARAALAGLRR